MKYPKRFLNAIKALYYAFDNQTLAKSHCGACAVENFWLDFFSYEMGETPQMKNKLEYDFV